MKKQCEYCKAGFFPVRNSKKFCSDRCKQLAHYARKGLEYLGMNPDKSISGQNESNSRALNSQNKKEEPFLTLNDKVKSAIDLENDKMEVLALNDRESPIADRLTIENSNSRQKLVNDKQLLPLNDKEVSINDSPTKENILHEEKLAKNDKEIIVERERPVIEKTQKPKSTYKWVLSKFLFDIGDYVTENYLIEGKFQFWRNRIPKEYIKEEIWVSLRFKCLVESLLRLSEIKRVDRPTILAVSRAFNALSKSTQFNCLGENTYPYKDFIRELQDKMKRYLAATRIGEEVFFIISREKKIQLIATRHIIGDFVPSIKFSELEFEEPENE